VAYYVKRDGNNNLSEVYSVPPDPENLGDYEKLHRNAPEIRKYFDANYSYRTWVRENIQSDPMWKIVVRRLAQLAGHTPATERGLWADIAENIFPDS
jgi:hypothetical protein